MKNKKKIEKIPIKLPGHKHPPSLKEIRE